MHRTLSSVHFLVKKDVIANKLVKEKSDTCATTTMTALTPTFYIMTRKREGFYIECKKIRVTSLMAGRIKPVTQSATISAVKPPAPYE